MILIFCHPIIHLRNKTATQKNVVIRLIAIRLNVINTS